MVATWYWDDSPHLSLPNSQPLTAAVGECARVTGKAGKNGQSSAERAAAHPGQDRRLPDVATHPRPWRMGGFRSI